MRDLQENTGAVASAGIGSHRAAMREIHQQLQRFLDDITGTNAVDMSDEADATGVVLVSRIVQSLLCRHSVLRSVSSR